ncbi:hypothetical protein OG349_22670 [Streptomyces sp. NBC_01317]|uniref:hypothetical protein n=1 Tax=Streptomyces sp. NBC_01317 TaxID=2903822 RepID=UPI002E135D94|nr:hypothetical protein OG349_22670 [Streptomyces sp. NBC_01317]
MRGADAQTTQYVAGTVGDDLLTVHEFKVVTDGDDHTTLEPVCPVANVDPTQWLRAVNCPHCLAAR